MPAIAKILIVFAVMLALSRVNVPLGLAIVLGGIALDLWGGAGVVGAARDFGAACLQSELWLFLAITVLIIEIGRFMTEKRNADEIIAATRRWGGRHGRAVSLMALPAIIGLIPMPAGALFSAPFVEQAGSIVNGKADWKSAVNYWFRHIWEYWWPLYPGVIVAMSVFDMATHRFLAAEIPLTLVAAGAGYLALIRPNMGTLRDERPAESGSGRRAAFLIMPLAIVVVTLLLLPILLRVAAPSLKPQTLKMSSLLAGLLLALAVVVFDRRKHAGPDAVAWHRAAPGAIVRLFDRKTMDILATLSAVIVFKFMLDRSGLLPLAGTEMARSGIPVTFAVAGLPFLAGLVTGLALGFTGTSFPLVVGLMGAQGSGLSPMSTLVLAYGFGHAGMMLSPIHLCLLVTRDYFRCGMAGVYRRLAPCILAVTAYAAVAHLVLKAAGL
jgi:integral membrane protein (TIGR00529 family)